MAQFTAEEKPSYLHLRFHAPESANALSLSAARELSGLAVKYKRLRKPVVVTSGHPVLFCSGGNLSDYAKLKGKAPGLKINREIQKHLQSFAAWPVPKIAVVEGDVFGGGMEWLAYFDFRWSTPYARFGFWQKRIGLSPGWGGGARWALRLGEARVRGLLVEGRLLGAAQASALGLVDRVISSWKIMDTVAADCADMAGVEPQLLKWSSKNESALFTGLWHGPKHAAALKRWK